MSDGKKIDGWKIPLYKIYTDDEDVDAITKIIKRGSRWAIGSEIEEFENALKKFIGVDYSSDKLELLLMSIINLSEPTRR